MINLNSKNKDVIDIITINSKNQYHGYHEYYYYNGIGYRANYKNNIKIGYEEYHRRNKTSFFIT